MDLHAMTEMTSAILIVASFLINAYLVLTSFVRRHGLLRAYDGPRMRIWLNDRLTLKTGLCVAQFGMAAIAVHRLITHNFRDPIYSIIWCGISLVLITTMLISLRNKRRLGLA